MYYFFKQARDLSILITGGTLQKNNMMQLEGSHLNYWDFFLRETVILTKDFLIAYMHVSYCKGIGGSFQNKIQYKIKRSVTTEVVSYVNKMLQWVFNFLKPFSSEILLNLICCFTLPLCFIFGMHDIGFSLICNMPTHSGWWQMQILIPTYIAFHVIAQNIKSHLKRN